MHFRSMLRPWLVLAFSGTLSLPAYPASAQQRDLREGLPPEICDSVRRIVSHQGDSLLSVKANTWRPDSTNRELLDAVRQADVVIQIRVDTLGNVDPRTFRAVKWKEMVFVNLARAQLENFGPMPYEPYAGCRVAYVLTLPINFSSPTPIRAPRGPCSIQLPCP